jgi:hypothetical protein
MATRCMPSGHKPWAPVRLSKALLRGNDGDRHMHADSAARTGRECSSGDYVPASVGIPVRQVHRFRERYSRRCSAYERHRVVLGVRSVAIADAVGERSVSVVLAQPDGDCDGLTRHSLC